MRSVDLERLLPMTIFAARGRNFSEKSPPFSRHGEEKRRKQRGMSDGEDKNEI
jgi:hypothetical protein